MIGLSPIQAAEEKAPPTQPTLVIRISSLDNLIASAKYLVGEAGKEDLANQAEGILKQFTGPKGLAGIDTTRPFGVYGRLSPNVVESPWAIMVPVADEKTLLDMVEKLGVKSEKQEDGSYKVDVPNSPLPAFARFANKYLYVTIGGMEKVAAKVLPMPESVFSPLESGCASLTINLDQIPEQLRELVIGQVSMRLADFKEKRCRRKPRPSAVRLAALDQGLVYLKTILNEGKSIRAGLDIDPKANEPALSLTMKGKSGSDMAAVITSLGKTRSSGTGLVSGSDSALNMMLSAAAPVKSRPLLMSVIDEGVKMIPLNKLDDTQKELAEMGIKARCQL